MQRKRFIPFVFFSALTILTLTTATACDPEPPQPTPTPVRSPTPTTLPTSTSTATSTPSPTQTPTVTPTPTETPQPTFVSIPGPQPTAIVNKEEAAARQKYEESLAKWRAQYVIQYELVVRHESTAPFAGTWTLRVAPDTIETLSYSAPGVITPTTPPAGLGGEALRFLTVEGLFQSVEFRLSEQFGPALEARADYLASFEPNLGYPIRVEIKPKRGDDLASSTTIERVTILRRAVVTPTPTPAPTDTPAPTATPTNTTPPTITPIPSTVTATPRAAFTSPAQTATTLPLPPGTTPNRSPVPTQPSP